MKNDTTRYPIDLQRALIQDGPKFLSHTVVIKGQTAYLIPTISSMLFCVLYIAVGVFLMSLASYVQWQSGQLDFAIFVGGFGIAITTFGVSLIQPFLKIANFNKSTDVFKNGQDRNVKLQHIVSMQINNKMVKRKQALSYECYELNMLTKNGRRINILNHNNMKQLQLDAMLLSQFLKVQVLDMQHREKRVD